MNNGAPARGSAMPSEVLLSLVIFVALVAARIPFLLTGHAQEDAYITFRTAFNLADRGLYSFNLDESYPGATSIFYGHLVALLRALFGPYAIQVTHLVNAASATAAAACLALALRPSGAQRATDGGESASPFVARWLAIGLCPPVLMLSYSGMETALLLLLISVAGALLRQGRFGAILHAALFLLPTVRIDAVLIGGIFVAGILLLDRRAGLRAAAALAAGVAATLAANAAYTGYPLPTTAIAKELTYDPARGWSAVAGRLFGVFLRRSFLAPYPTKFFTPWIYSLIGLGGLSVLTLVAWRGWRKLWRSPGSDELDERRTACLSVVLVAVAVAPPAAYAYGGVLAAWYLWPSAAVAYAVVLSWFVGMAWRWAPRRRRFALFALGGALALAGAGRWALSVNTGFQESVYRTGVGRFIHSIAPPDATLFLEPAGYIPFYAGLKTYDEVGLTSEIVLDFKRTYGGRWWFPFIHEIRPTFLVQREHFLKRQTGRGYEFTSDEWQWLQTHYTLIRHFRYDQAATEVPAWRRPFVRLGRHSDYLVYRLRTDGDEARGPNASPD